MLNNSPARSRNRISLVTTALLVGSALLIGGCSSSNLPDGAATAMGGKGKAKGNSGTSTATNAVATVTSPSVAVATTPAATYDNSIGNGVDANGFASLPLRAGAHRFYVNSASGSDARTCAQAQSPSTPLATIHAGANCIVAGNGDQVLVAQGASFSEGLPSLYSHGGYSPTYPTVIQSYDPADPTNEAKMGQAGTLGRPLVNTGGTTTQTIAGHTGSAGTSSPQYLAIRGLDIAPPNGPDYGLTFFGEALNAPSYVLFENNIFRYTGIGADLHQSPIRGTNWIFRNNAFYGMWSNDVATAGQALYLAFIDGATIEDNIFYHVGWKIGANRTDTMSAGGLNYYRHPIYFQEDAINGTARRNLFLDGYDGGSMRGDVTRYIQNLSLNNSIGVALGRGDEYSTYVPNGAVQEVAYNAILGSGTTPSSATDRGVWMYNGKQNYSSVHHNVFARSVSQSDYSFAPDDAGDPTHPTYTDFHDNVAWNWAASGHSLQVPTWGLTVATYENNIWDNPASGSNTNIAAHTFPNTYDETSLLAALGYANEAAFVADVTANPEKHVQRQAVLLMLNGYGVNTSAMTW